MHILLKCKTRVSLFKKLNGSASNPNISKVKLTARSTQSKYGKMSI